MSTPKPERARRKRSYAKSRTWLAWSGEMEDLRRIGRIVEELYERRYATTFSETRGEKREYIQEEMKELTLHTYSSTINYFAPQAGGDIDEYPFLGLITTAEDRVSGEIADLLNEVDRRSIKRLLFAGAIHPRDRVLVTFSRDGDFAAKIEVESSDVGWARQALSHLSDEIEKGVPRWEFLLLHTGFGYLWPRVLATLLPTTAVTAAFYDKTRATEGGTYVIFALVFMLFMGVFSSNWLSGWLFPKFEILGEGAPSTASRRLGMVFAIALSVPVGVFVNWIY